MFRGHKSKKLGTIALLDSIMNLVSGVAEWILYK